jgi:hypothetical protein
MIILYKFAAVSDNSFLPGEGLAQGPVPIRPIDGDISDTADSIEDSA